MRIVHVCHAYYPSIGGNQFHMRELSEGLVQLGEDVTVLTTTVIHNEQLYTRQGCHERTRSAACRATDAYPGS